MALGTDIGNVVKYTRGGEWRVRFEAVLNDHVSVVLPAFKAETYEDLVRVIGPRWGMTLWGCAFEDMATRVYADGEETGNLMDVFLKRRGWKEKLLTRGYLISLGASFPSLYDVCEVDPGVSVVVRDLLGEEEEAVLVHEKTATQMLSPGDRLVARIAEAGKKKVFGGGLLPFSHVPEGIVREPLLRRFGPGPYSKTQLRAAAPDFSAAWLRAKHTEIIESGESALETADAEMADRIRAILADARAA